MRKERGLIERLQSGEKILCKDCGKGFYITNARNIKTSHDFVCEKCNSVVRVTPNNIIVE